MPYRTGGLAQHFVDTKMLALKSWGIPPSLDLRLQVLKLKFVSPKIEGRFVEPEMPVQLEILSLQGIPSKFSFDSPSRSVAVDCLT